MSDLALALQGAIYAKLSEPGSPLEPLVGDRIYDRVPVDPAGKIKATFPYVTIRDSDTVDAGADCVEAEDITVTIHVWSRAVGVVEAKRIGGALKSALHEVELPMGSGQPAAEILWRGAQYRLDPDGLTTHGVIEFLALAEG